jgi:NDP-sugar pyrophosphorylase family protein
MQCVILAGGLGTRISSITGNKIPKSMVLINSNPFIDYQLKLLSSQKISKVLLITGYLGHEIKSFVKDGSQYNLDVEYVEEGPNLLGTGGALKLALDQGKLDSHFFVTYGDSYLPIDWQAIYNQYDGRAIMTIYRNLNLFDKSNVLLDKVDNTILYDKQGIPNAEHIDYGLLVLNKQNINHIPSGQKYDLSTILKELSYKYELHPVEVTERFYEIGSPQGIEDFSKWVGGK